MAKSGIYLSAAAVRSGAGLPNRCTRHGQLLAKTRPVRFLSKTTIGTYVLLLFSVGLGLIVMFFLRDSVTAPRWPLCSRCLAERRHRIGAMWLFLVGVPAAYVMVTKTIGATSDLGGPLLIMCLLVSPIAGLIAGSYGSMATLVGGSVVTRGVEHHGVTLELVNPHPLFSTDFYALSATADAAR